MRKDDFLIKVTDDGVPLVHIKNIGPTDHVTMCGLDGFDDGVGQEILRLKRGDKMNCQMCLHYYENRKSLNIKKDWIESVR